MTQAQKGNLDFSKRETLAEAIQVGLENELVTPLISEMIPEQELQHGKSYAVPSVNDPMSENYQIFGGFKGTPLTSKSNEILINETPGAMFSVDKVEQKQISNELGKKMAQKLMYVTKNNIDQFTIKTGVLGAGIDLGNQGTVSADSYRALFGRMEEELGWSNGDESNMYSLVNPQGINKIQQNYVNKGFNEADRNLKTGFSGMFGNFKTYRSNNLPVEALLTLDTLPSNGQVMNVMGENVRFMTTPVTAGDIKLGTLAETQARLVAFLNASGVGDGTDYIEYDINEYAQLSARVKFNNSKLDITDFDVDDKALVTGCGRLRASIGTVTGGNNGFAAEYTYYLFGSKNAISSAVQMMPEIEIRKPSNNKVLNYMCNALHGGAVLGNNAQRLGVVKVELENS